MFFDSLSTSTFIYIHYHYLPILYSCFIPQLFRLLVLAVTTSEFLCYYLLFFLTLSLPSISSDFLFYPLLPFTLSTFPECLSLSTSDISFYYLPLVTSFCFLISSTTAHSTYPLLLSFVTKFLLL